MGQAIQLAKKTESIQKGQTNFDINDFDLNDSDREDFDNYVDILFVLDQSGSMSTYIKQAKQTICKIVEKFKNKEYDLKFSLCTYIDHTPQSEMLTDFTDLCSGYQIVQKLHTVIATGGGDIPEAVMDGLRDGITKTSWRKTVIGKEEKSQRFLFHICDAPPHGEEYGFLSSDKQWSINGCPCGTKREDIKNLLQLHDIQYFLIKPNHAISKMEQLFKECFGDYFKDTINLSENFQQKDNKTQMWEGVLSNIEKNVS
ncbi:von willebrand factor type A domain protein (macronuclear) [Tetrahymena thermophila SB210]|uniref:von willebrand factor type A domain protein n=1 Tax=Tetrahymena thermophila (strain SB210) TaxID=312017 RepID=Q245K1_TETTS|nr:von willebrand factor type A domain protein [Tetrahymena thermophila SB210]EAS03631.1 von willebrand factor type A domain protein [Tetrahymena thermophila SB210]|eukprot:XP_001023877.1 von willebrand factor type A domain protein [Tetrahymena thermophila SB210]